MGTNLYLYKIGDFSPSTGYFIPWIDSLDAGPLGDAGRECPHLSRKVIYQIQRPENRIMDLVFPQLIENIAQRTGVRKINPR